MATIWLPFLAKSVWLNVPLLMENSTAQLELVEKSENCPVFIGAEESPTLSAILFKIRELPGTP